VNQTLSISRLANVGAEVILSAFETYRGRFGEITCRAQARFEQREWFAMRGDTAERLDLYRQVVDRTLAELQTLLGARIGHKLVWASVKAVYSGLIARCHQWELAETFFNSITRRIFTTVGVDSEIEFVDSDFEGPPTPTQAPIVRWYGAPASLPALVSAMLADGPFQTPYQDLPRDARLTAERIAQHLHSDGAVAAPGASEAAVEGAEIITSVFYRGSAAYMVGRLFWAGMLSRWCCRCATPRAGSSWMPCCSTRTMSASYSASRIPIFTSISIGPTTWRTTSS
jgi:isocitrate dehydrogenase kinase/phosphatase